MLRCLFVSIAYCLGTAATAQTGLSGWHRDGQTWLVWTDTGVTFTGVDSWSIHRSPLPFGSLADVLAAERIGRLYPFDCKAERLQASAPGSTWTIPAAISGTYTLATGQSLFVYTPHAAAAEYFAVLKTGSSTYTALATPIAQSVGGVQPHVQHSGTDGGHPYDVYAYWIDGRSDHTTGVAGFPVMGSASCHGVPFLFGVFEPQAGLPTAPMPAVVFLHGGGGSYWSYRPSRGPTVMLNLDVENGLYVSCDENLYLNYQGSVYGAATRWFGTCQLFDRFADVLGSPTIGDVVVNYAQRRLQWIIDWLQSTQSVDPLRTAMAGLSLGGRGTHMFARAFPQELCAALAFVPPTEFEGGDGPALLGTTAAPLATTLPGSPLVTDVLEPFDLFATADQPFTRIVCGTNDTVAPWTNKPTLYEHLDTLRTGAAMYWDGRGHTHGSAAGWAGQYFTLSPKHAVESLTGFRANQSFPAFHGVDHDLAAVGQQPDPGDPVVPANGSPSGTWGGWFAWDTATIVDSTTSWSVRLWLETASTWPADNAPLPTARASVTLRRLQSFAVAPHEVLWCELANATTPSTIYWSGGVQAGADGTITIPNLPFGAQHLVLSVRQVAAGPALVPYGVATAGCPGLPTIAGNGPPFVNTPGFAILHGNAPANWLGLGVFGTAPANVPLFGLSVHVELLTPPALLVALLSDAAGSAAMPVPIPNTPGLAGLSYYVQGAWFDSCALGGFSSSRGLAFTVQ
ncbi:MAG: hypothetical protein WAT39_14810 [Planctomycetota bacterium]